MLVEQRGAINFGPMPDDETYIKEEMERIEMNHTAKLIFEQGFGFGEGQISGAEISQTDKDILHKTILNSPDTLVDVDRDDDGQILDDDGCSDGRPVDVIWRGGHVLKRSLNRAKVFGGSLVMTAAGKIGLGKVGNMPLNDVYDQSIETLNERRIDFGAHVADHFAEGGCGCGAIDTSPQDILAITKYEQLIRDTINKLGVDSTGLDEVLDNFRQYGQQLDAQTYSGERVMQKIKQAGKVIKRLCGGHTERAVIINSVAGRTVNQGLFRELTDGRVEVFGVDVWRMQEIAQRTYSDPAEQQRAFLSGLAFTLATAAVLTKGDLPVYMITPAAEVETSQPELAYA